jgi:uncharacterized protein
MRFEFDPEKSVSNHAKHGIDFIEAQKLWNDPFLLIVEAKTIDEARYLAIGQIGFHHWTGVYTLRHGNVRIVSVRRAREEEVRYYEST